MMALSSNTDPTVNPSWGSAYTLIMYRRVQLVSWWFEVYHSLRR